MVNFNHFVTLILTSPFHGLFGFSRNMLLLTVTGRKSGKLYTFPVDYVQSEDTLLIVSQQHRTWWKNLADGAQVRVCLRGKVIPAQATAITHPEHVTRHLENVLQARPMAARAFRVRRNHDGFNRDDLNMAAAKLVGVEVQLATARKTATARIVF